MFRLAAFALAITSLMLSGCSVALPFSAGNVLGSGKQLTRAYDLQGYTDVEVGNAFHVDISRADTFSTTITANDNMYDYIRVSKQGARLVIGLDPAYSYMIAPGSLNAKITMPTLEEVNLSGATRATVSGFSSAGDIRINLSGASQLDGSIDAGDARFETSGASRTSLRGSGKSANINSSGASQIDLGDWPVQSAVVNLNGASNATVNVSSELDYDLSGGSRLTIEGSATIGRSNTSRGSSVTRQ